MLDDKNNDLKYLDSNEKTISVFKKFGLIFLCTILLNVIIYIINPNAFESRVVNDIKIDKPKDFYYIDEFLKDYEFYSKITGAPDNMYLKSSKEMNILFLDDFFSVSSSRNSQIGIEIFQKIDYMTPNKTVTAVTTPYLLISENFDTNFYNINTLKETYVDTVNFRGYIIPNSRARQYSKRSFLSNDNLGNNTFIFEEPIYSIIENIDKKTYRDISYPENHKMYPLYPIKAYVTFSIDEKSVRSNNAYVIYVEEENKLGDKFSYQINISDKEFIKFKEKMSFELEDYNTNFASI